MIKIDNYKISNFELIEVSGRLDTDNADNLDELVIQILEKDCRSFLFDLSELEYISSYGIRIFVKLLKKSVKISLVVKSDSVFSILKMTGLEDPLNIKGNLKDAIKSLHI